MWNKCVCRGTGHSSPGELTDLWWSAHSLAWSCLVLLQLGAFFISSQSITWQLLSILQTEVILFLWNRIKNELFMQDLVSVHFMRREWNWNVKFLRICFVSSNNSLIPQQVQFLSKLSLCKSAKVVTWWKWQKWLQTKQASQSGLVSPGKPKVFANKQQPAGEPRSLSRGSAVV